MGHIVNAIEELKVAADSYVYLSFEDYAEVWHVSDDFMTEAIAETATAEALADLIAAKGCTVLTEYGANILEDLREDFLLEDYPYNNTFGTYLREIIQKSGYEYGYLDIATERYDHKRGRCDVSAAVKVPISNVVALGNTADEVFANWRVTLSTKNGKLTLE